MPDDLVRLRLTGRATDSQFSQNPIPVLRSMGHSLAELHRGDTTGLASATEGEAEAVRAHLDSGAPLPSPYTGVRPEVVREVLDAAPTSDAVVRTHGAPIVDVVVLDKSVATFESRGTEGADPPERDLAIVLRSIAETFAPEASAAFLDTYVEAGGSLPDVRSLDWYALLAAFR